jgi:hypothetical protein
MFFSVEVFSNSLSAVLLLQYQLFESIFAHFLHCVMHVLKAPIERKKRRKQSAIFSIGSATLTETNASCAL